MDWFTANKKGKMSYQLEFLLYCVLDGKRIYKKQIDSWIAMNNNALVTLVTHGVIQSFHKRL